MIGNHIRKNILNQGLQRFYEGYWLTERFKFDMRRTELSSLILSNQISRKEAIEILKIPPLDKSFAEKGV